MSTNNSKNTTSNTNTMTAEQAKAFTSFSQENAIIVESGRTCGCKAYESIFTYARWQALGFQVQKGEKGTKIRTYRKVVEKDPESGEEKVVGKAPWYSVVFCQCQVKELEAKPGNKKAGSKKTSKPRPKTKKESNKQTTFLPKK